MMQTYDVIIIGAGPAGLMAARELGANKVNYLIIEANSTIGSALKCGEITRQDKFFELFGYSDYPFIKNKISMKTRVLLAGLFLKKTMSIMPEQELF
jgi:cation diffusion facilitator CzcD-associated flavoprotein CzcO